MKVIKRPDYSNGVLSLSSKPLSRHRSPHACAINIVSRMACWTSIQTSCHTGYPTAFAIPPIYGSGVRFAIRSRDHYATGAMPHRHRGRNGVNVERKKEELSFQQNVSGDFPARPKWLLRFSVQLCFDATGIS